jgi:hypothetical protein
VFKAYNDALYSLAKKRSAGTSIYAPHSPEAMVISSDVTSDGVHFSAGTIKSGSNT